MDIILGHHLVSYSVMKTDFFEENAINSTNEMGKKKKIQFMSFWFSLLLEIIV